MQIITRKEAKEKGLSRYFTGKACTKGHIAERRVANHCCAVCSNEQSKQYQKIKRETAEVTAAGNPKHQQSARKAARQSAVEKGEKTYFHGIPCKRGHVAPRQTSNGMCLECARKKNNSDKTKAYKRKHRLENKDRYLQLQREARAANLDKFREYHREYFQKNKEELTKKNHLRQKERLATDPEYREAVKKKREQWRIKNRDYFTKYAIKRSAVLQKATPSWANLSSITTKYKERDTMSGLTGLPHHVDHIVPLQGKNICGLHVPWNLRVIPAIDNLRKSNKLITQ